MKLLLLASLLVLVNASFVEFLQGLQHHSSFQRLPEEEKLLFGQLVVAAEEDELTEFIDRTGLIHVLKLMDHMSHYDGERFAAYLAEHSNYTHHAPGHEDVINRKRRDDDDDDDHHSRLGTFLGFHSSYYGHLPSEERSTYNGLLHAAERKHLKQYIDSVGYGAVFGLLESLDGGHSYQVTKMLENALAAEAAASSGVKRQISHFYEYLSSLNSHYYEHLPPEERETYGKLVAAVRVHNVTGLVSAEGYGPIFGFIEHLDYVHANQVYDYLSHALLTEASKASAAQN